MRQSIYILLVLCVGILPSTTFSQSVQSRIDSTVFLIGDQTTLYVEASTPNEADDVTFFTTGLDTSQSIELVRRSDLYKVVEEAGMTYRREFIVAFFDTGAIYIPPMPVVLQFGDRRDSLLASPIPILIKPPATDSLQLADIKPIIREPWKVTDAWPILLGVLAVGLLILFLMRRSKLRAQNREEIEEVPMTPFEIAMQDLNELDSQNLIEQGEVKEHFSILSVILRSYLERVFRFPAMELTTREIEYHLKTYLADEHLQTNIRLQLERIDLIKYAKVAPDEAEISEGLESIRARIMKINDSLETKASEEEE